jgi:hypothetical protein
MKANAVWRSSHTAVVVLLCSLSASAEEDTAPAVVPLEEVVVQGRAEDLVGVAPAASMGRVGQAEIQPVPLLRVGEVLERVPGLIATQHSGTGVDALVATQGAEIGTRSTWIPGLQSTLAFWWLELDSELLFIGDAGTTEATRPSRRDGVELTNYYQVFRWLTLDGDFTWTHSEFTDRDPAGDHIPGAIETTVAAGAAVSFDNGLFGGLHVRHFGPRPLIEDDSVESASTTLVNLRAGYDWFAFPWGDLTFTLDVLNLLDSKDDDITYFYASRLPGEPADGIEDKHFHPVEPQMVRGYVTYRF